MFCSFISIFKNGPEMFCIAKGWQTRTEKLARWISDILKKFREFSQRLLFKTIFCKWCQTLIRNYHLKNEHNIVFEKHLNSPNGNVEATCSRLSFCLNLKINLHLYLKFWNTKGLSIGCITWKKGLHPQTQPANHSHMRPFPSQDTQYSTASES